MRRRVFGRRSEVDLQAAGWIVWVPGGGWRVSPAGRAYMKRLLAAYTRADADRDRARSRCAGSGGGELRYVTHNGGGCGNERGAGRNNATLAGRKPLRGRNDDRESGTGGT